VAGAATLNASVPLVRRGGSGATWAALSGDRTHFQHGPIDLVIDVRAAPAARALALAAAWTRFDGLLQELVAELPSLRTAVDPTRDARLQSPVALRMVAACRPHAGRFITPMAAVAGSVADEILATMTAAAPLDRAAVNNGGDIALHLSPGTTWRLGIAGDPASVADATLDGTFELAAEHPVRGVATSGWRGRSLSLGIADTVTVLARDAAGADAAATMIANAVHVDHPGIVRARACDVVDDSDLGERLVTRHVPRLDSADIALALDRGAAHAQMLVACGVVHAAVLRLQGATRVVGDVAPSPTMISATGLVAGEASRGLR
jgi:ApbE superfamily uncharacterized protein (UPF0280 family)